MRNHQANVYGFPEEISAEEVIDYIENSLLIPLQARESFYVGDYWAYSDGDKSLKVRYNEDPLHDPESDPPEEYYFDDENQDCHLLLLLDGKPEWVSELHQKLLNLQLIKYISHELY